MLIDLHACPGDLDPDSFAAACRDAGLDAVVVTDRLRTDRLDDYLDALDEVGVQGFVGVQIPLDRGAVVVIPRDDSDDFRALRWSPPWSAESLPTRLGDFDGIAIAAHPYHRERDAGPTMGDRVYFLKIKQLAAIETRLGRGEPGWDRMADQAAEKRGLARIGSSSGDAKFIGTALTVVTGEIETQSDLIDALRAGRTLPVELEDPANPRKRPAPEPRRRDDEGDRGPRRDDRGERGDRGPRRDDRGDRGPRRDGGGDRGPRRDGGGDRGPRRDGGDRGPRREEGGDRGPRRDDGDRGPRRDDGDRGPRRDAGDRAPRRDDADRGPRRDAGERAPRRDDDRPPRRDDADRPRRDAGDRPERGNERAPRRDDDRPERGNERAPRRDDDRPAGDRPERGNERAPRRDDDRPPRRDVSDRPERGNERAPRRDDDRPPRRDDADRPRRDVSDRPAGDRPERGNERAPRRDEAPRGGGNDRGPRRERGDGGRDR